MASYANGAGPILACCPPGTLCRPEDTVTFKDVEPYAKAPVAWFTRNFFIHAALMEIPNWKVHRKVVVPEDFDGDEFYLEEFMKYDGPQGAFVWKLDGTHYEDHYDDPVHFPRFIKRGAWPD